jgi:glycosyltransferase involved in cell wall biosynthesis
MTITKNILEVYYEPAISGITRHVGQFVKRLNGENLRFHILCSTNDPRISEYYRALGVPVYTVPAAKYFSIRGMWEAVRLIKRLNINIVHIHNLQSIFWAHLPRLIYPRVSFILTPHIINFENRTLERIFYITWRIFSILTDNIIALSAAQKGILIRNRIKRANAVIVIPNSISEEEVGCAGTDEKCAPLPTREPYILSIIRLVRQKDPLRIIAIAEKVCQQNPAVHFFIVGEGPLNVEMKMEIEKKGLGGRVFLLGYRKDTPSLIRHATIILSTSLWEGMPYSLLEAMYLGKPIVVSDIAGHQALVQRGLTGYLAESDEDFINHIAILMRDETKRTEMGLNARKYFDEHFAFDLFLKKMKTLYVT